MTERQGQRINQLHGFLGVSYDVSHLDQKDAERYIDLLQHRVDRQKLSHIHGRKVDY